jgi:hypothetical protein
MVGAVIAMAVSEAHPSVAVGRVGLHSDLLAVLGATTCPQSSTYRTEAWSSATAESGSPLSEETQIGLPARPAGWPTTIEKTAIIDTHLAGQNVLLTGEPGNISAAISRAFATQGARVAIHHLAQAPPAPTGTEWARITPAREEAIELAEELGNNSFAVSADLSEPDGASQLAREVVSRV